MSTVSAQKGNEKTGALLWKISGNGLEQPSYVFGTQHFTLSTFLDSIECVKQAFASCEQMVGEVVINDVDTLATEVQKAEMMPQDTTLQMLLSAEDYRFVDEQLTAVCGVGLQSFGLLKPSVISLKFMSSLYERMFSQINTSEILDIWFQRQAVNKGIPVIGLETVQYQIKIVYEAKSLKQQAADLVSMLKNTDDLEIGLKTLNNLYHSADLKGLSEIFNEENLTELEARNKRWLEKLPAIMAEKPSFIAVGCLHLVGEEGILVGLEQLGYIVEPVIEICDGSP